jgi:hypothetical protein
MTIRGLVNALFAALAFSSVPFPAAAQERNPERVARLIRDLGAPSYSDRQRASVELARLGTATREQLAAAAGAADPEVRARARHLLRLLQVDDLWQPRLVTLHVDEQPLESVLRQVAAQTSNHLATGSRYEPFHERAVKLDLEQRSYWQVLDELCRQTGNHFRPHYDVREAGVVLTAGSPGQNPVAYSGPFRVELASCRRVYDDELNYKNMESKRLHSFKLVFNVLWEDRLQLTAYRATPRVTVALTDGRQPLLPVEVVDTWNVVGGNTRQLSLEVKLQPPGLRSERLENLLMEWSLLAVGDYAELVVDDLANPAAVRQDALEVVVESCSAKSESLHEVVLATTYDELLPDPPESVFHENSYELRDEQGSRFTLVDQAHDLRGDLVRSKLTFRRESNAENSPPHSLKVRYPRIRSQRDMHIMFRDIPLPQPIEAAH